MIRLAIVEDAADLRQAMALKLGKQPDFTVVGEFADAETAESLLPDLVVDVVLIKVPLSGIGSSELVRRMKPRMAGTEFLMLTHGNENDLGILDSLNAGAMGCVDQGDHSLEVATAVREIINGGCPLSSSISRKFISPTHEQRSADPDRLSPRERELLELLAKGLTFGECAAALGVSSGTIHAFIGQLFRKYRSRRR